MSSPEISTMLGTIWLVSIIEEDIDMQVGKSTGSLDKDGTVYADVRRKQVTTLLGGHADNSVKSERTVDKKLNFKLQPTREMNGQHDE